MSGVKSFLRIMVINLVRLVMVVDGEEVVGIMDLEILVGLRIVGINILEVLSWNSRGWWLERNV